MPESHADPRNHAAEPEPEVETRRHADPEPPPAEDRPLHVALDVRCWEMSGLGTFVRELLAAFARLHLPVRWTLIGPDHLRERIPVELDVARWIEFDAPLYALGSTLRYPRLGPVDVFHYPHYNLPLARARAKLVNVFDLFHLKYGTFAKRCYQRAFLKRLRWSGATLVTASEKTTRELRLAARLGDNRLAGIVPGPGRQVDPGIAAGVPEVKSLAGTPLRGPWLLATGIDQPHKNFDFLLSALSLYFQRRPDAPSFIWMGLSEEAIQRRAKALPAQVRPRIALEPYRDAGHVEGLLRGARALVFPSLDEGFGFPPLEAMTRGVPVLCARREPMTTLLGGAPLYFEPAESASLWRMLDRLIDHPEIREELIDRGHAQAARYSWDRAALHYYQLYREVSGA